MTNDRISPEEARRNYAYSIKEFGVEKRCNVRLKIESMIKPTWLHFGPRPDDHNQWLDKVKEDAESELHRAREHLQQVEEALNLLSKIDREAD